MTSTSQDLFKTVVPQGFCIGCGACAAFDPTIKIRLNDQGCYIATRSGGEEPCSPVAARVCPFAEGTPNEDQLARELFGAAGPLDPHIGHHLASFAGWAAESDYRASGSSGGLVTWLLVELLERGMVDHIVHVAPHTAPGGGVALFHFAISSTPGEVRARSKSRYYPVEMSQVLAEMLRQPGRYAVVGVPCFIKAVRLACRELPVLKERLAYTVGIVCGHLKSTAFAEMFAWQCGIAPGNLRSIDFRSKLPNRPASSYGITVTGQCKEGTLSVTRPTSELFGSNWGHGFFKYKACDFCDDVVGETADISLGDAWLPEYTPNSAGTNVVVVRSPSLLAVLNEARDSGRLHLDTIPVAKVVESQAAGFRHRREGLAYRLWLEDQVGRWRPTKRVAASACHLTPKLRRIHSLRQELSQTSHEAFAQAKTRNDFQFFVERMSPLMTRYERQYRAPFFIRLTRRFVRLFRQTRERFLTKTLR